MATDIASHVRQLFDEAWNKGNVRFIDDHCTDDFVMHEPGMGDLDREGFKQFLQTYRSAFPDLRFKLDDVYVAGDVGICRWTATGTHRGELMGIPPTNVSSSVTGISIARFAGDKQRETWAQWDALGLLRTLGVAPGMGTSAQPQPAQQPARPAAPRARH